MFHACKWVAACPILALVLLAAGCGSGDDPGPESPPADGGTPAGPTDGSAAGDDQATAEPDSLHPVVIIQTSLGEITVELDAETADMTVDNFLRYVDSGHYANTIFHEVHQDQVVIGGAFTPELEEKKTDGPIFNQARQTPKNLRGTIAMARRPDVTDSATCHFFINLQDHPSLDHKSAKPAEDYGYCVFGKVTQGMDVADRIGQVEVHDMTDFDSIPVENVVIQSIRRAD